VNSFEDLLPSSVHVSTRSGQLQRGLSKAQIGRELLLSPFAVGVFMGNALMKLGVRSELEAIALVLRGA
jgi:DNA-binding NarL/FixJ family response regulator